MLAERGNLVEQTNELILDAITTIANSDKLKEMIEPNVRYHQILNKLSVARVLKSYLLFVDEWEKNGRKETRTTE